MNVVVFVGPTLSLDDARAVLDARYLPPAAQGDVYRAALEGPTAIGVIDGYFAHVSSIAHKELLWAMSRGIRVFGSASMGALRASELAAFGMQGVGKVFDALQSGALEDDDEVAVAHAPAELGYRALSEALVNLRATLHAAELAGALDAPSRACIERVAKALFYPERTWPAVLARAAQQGVAAEVLTSLREFLPRGRVDQKREDALEMLRRMRAVAVGPLEPGQPGYRFQHTEAWEVLRRRVLASSRVSGQPSLEALQEESALAGVYAAELPALRSRAFALELAEREAYAPTPSALEQAAATLCSEQGLPALQALARWQHEQGVEQLEPLLRREAQRRWAEARIEPALARALPDHLRLRGLYAALCERAEARRRCLAERGCTSPTLDDLGIDEAQLWCWYFEEHRRREVPADLAAYARAQGFRDEGALQRAALRELAFARWA